MVYSERPTLDLRLLGEWTVSWNGGVFARQLGPV
jgi:hypothetical protein